MNLLRMNLWKRKFQSNLLTILWWFSGGFFLISDKILGGISENSYLKDSRRNIMRISLVISQKLLKESLNECNRCLVPRIQNCSVFQVTFWWWICGVEETMLKMNIDFLFWFYVYVMFILRTPYSLFDYKVLLAMGLLCENGSKLFEKSLLCALTLPGIASFLYHLVFPTSTSTIRITSMLLTFIAAFRDTCFFILLISLKFTSFFLKSLTFC